MNAKSLFNIILKILGIYFIKDIIIAIPTIIGVIYDFGRTDIVGAISTLLITSATLFVYGLAIYYLVFRSDFVIERLKLTDRIPEDPIPLNIHRSTVLSIAVIVVALLLITQGIPMVVRELTRWYQYNRATRGFFNSAEPFDFSLMIVYVVEIIIGLLLIGNQAAVVNYIELRQRKKSN